MAVAAQSPGLALARPAEDEPGEIDRLTLEACRRAEPAALRRFVLHHQRPVFALLSRMLGHGPHVEDVAQEVFVKSLQALPKFDPDGPAKVSTWLLGIASRAAIDWRRRSKVKLVSIDDAAPLAGGRTPEEDAQRGELARAFDAAAARLDDDQRMVLVLAEFHGLSMSEMSQVLGVAENTIKTRLFRARERMRAMLESVREA
jgi:RNA polymerase sigma factor (sigma-70 family)